MRRALLELRGSQNKYLLFTECNRNLDASLLRYQGFIKIQELLDS